MFWKYYKNPPQTFSLRQYMVQLAYIVQLYFPNPLQIITPQLFDCTCSTISRKDVTICMEYCSTAELTCFYTPLFFSHLSNGFVVSETKSADYRKSSLEGRIPVKTGFKTQIFRFCTQLLCISSSLFWILTILAQSQNLLVPFSYVYDEVFYTIVQTHHL